MQVTRSSVGGWRSSDGGWRVGGARLLNGSKTGTCGSWSRTIAQEEVHQARDLAANLRAEAMDGCFKAWFGTPLLQAASIIER